MQIEMTYLYDGGEETYTHGNIRAPQISYVRLRSAKVFRTVPIESKGRDLVLIDFDKKGRVVGVEVSQ